ncbi:Ovarian cancer-associated protein 2 [Basidiobolus ranarum]|uniref:Ovarian cancer-associated protein 2 n=1 Tax=Basidiobolus ranarum TaxID=34480 RepID=A0ABR2WJT4_9FUNG
MSVSVPRRPLRILCLHGYLQSAEVFEGKSKQLRKWFGKNDLAELVYLNAPHVGIPILKEGDIEVEDNKKVEDQYGWYTFKLEERAAGKWRGVETGLDYIYNFMKKEGPFDGLLGFSQGATIVAVICAQQQLKLAPEEVNQLKFAIMFSGIKSFYATHVPLFSTKIELPSFHSFGQKDTWIVPAMSQELADCFVNPIVHEHPQGHVVPSKSEAKRLLVNFLEQFSKN